LADDCEKGSCRTQKEESRWVRCGAAKERERKIWEGMAALPSQHSRRAQGEGFMTSGGSTPILRQHTKATLTVFICVAQKLTDTNNDYDY
jgi:hypothetical protein